jgi:uncharacterized protein (TIGR03086 family)
MDIKQLFDTCLSSATRVIHKVKQEQFGDSTPDTEWDVQALVSHMLYELSWVPDILEGLTITEVGDKYDGNLIGDDLQVSWDQAEAKARQAVERVDPTKIIHLSYGDFPTRHYLQQESNDQLIHSWDLGTAIGTAVRFDPEATRHLYQETLPNKDQLAATGLFAPAIEVSDSEDIQTKLLALFGRKA